MITNPRAMSMEALHRKGAWLIAQKTQWKMTSVHGPIAIDEEDREYFRVETACDQVLLVSRKLGEKGMRELRLDSVITPLKRAVNEQDEGERLVTVA